jgi:hypothetical protein
MLITDTEAKQLIADQEVADMLLQEEMTEELEMAQNLTKDAAYYIHMTAVTLEAIRDYA